jgi:hypothetical protein
MATKTKKRITATQILQRTINDFTKHPEHWTQEDFGTNPQYWVDYGEVYYGDDETALSGQRAANKKKQWELFSVERKKAGTSRDRVTVTQPGNGKKSAFDFFGLETETIVGEAQQYCGLGGVEQNAWKLNKEHFWDNDFQRELAWVGAYLDWRAQKRLEPSYLDDERVPFTDFVGFNDDDSTTVQDVIGLMKETLVYLKKRDKENAKKREKRAAAKVSA